MYDGAYVIQNRFTKRYLFVDYELMRKRWVDQARLATHFSCKADAEEYINDYKVENCEAVTWRGMAPWKDKHVALR